MSPKMPRQFWEDDLPMEYSYSDLSSRNPWKLRNTKLAALKAERDVYRTALERIAATDGRKAGRLAVKVLAGQEMHALSSEDATRPTQGRTE